MLRLHLVIGVGGTGSYLVPKLCDYLKDTTENVVLLIDGDVVEAKNLERQSYTLDDINKNKSVATLTNYNVNYPKLLMGAFPNYIVSIKHFTRLINLLRSLFKIDEIVVYGCVDNNAMRARLTYITPLLYKQLGIPITYIDSGNSEFSGQVLTTIYSDKLKESNSILVDLGKFTESLTYADFEISCADVAVSSPQNIYTNQLAATVILRCLKDLDNGFVSHYSFDALEGLIYQLPSVDKVKYKQLREEIKASEWLINENKKDSFYKLIW